MSEQTYTLVLVALPNDGLKRTPEQRLRAALKALKRGYGLRALSVRPSEPAAANVEAGRGIVIDEQLPNTTP